MIGETTPTRRTPTVTYHYAIVEAIAWHLPGGKSLRDVLVDTAVSYARSRGFFPRPGLAITGDATRHPLAVVAIHGGSFTVDLYDPED